MGWRCIRRQTAFVECKKGRLVHGYNPAPMEKWRQEDCKFKAILDYSKFEVSLSYMGQTIQDPEHAEPTCSHWVILPTLTNQPFSECVHYSRSFMSSPNVSTAERMITTLSISPPVTHFSRVPSSRQLNPDLN